jgi:hypothetical protein
METKIRIKDLIKQHVERDEYKQADEWYECIMALYDNLECEVTFED